MTRAEYDSKLAELERQLAELKDAEIEEEKPQPPHPMWKPEKDATYWYISEYGTILKFVWYGDEDDEYKFKFGNLYKTKEEADYVAERLRVLAEMREWAGEWNDSYAIIYNYYMDMLLTPDKRSLYPAGEIRFATVDDAQNCIKAVGADRIKKYYFQVSEDE